MRVEGSCTFPHSVMRVLEAVPSKPLTQGLHKSYRAAAPWHLMDTLAMFMLCLAKPKTAPPCSYALVSIFCQGF